MAADQWLIYLRSAASGSLMIRLLISVAKEFGGKRSGGQSIDRHL